LNLAIFVQLGDGLPHLAVGVGGCRGLHLEKVVVVVVRS
jgi:hypothetical protein